MKTNANSTVPIQIKSIFEACVCTHWMLLFAVCLKFCNMTSAISHTHDCRIFVVSHHNRMSLAVYVCVCV